MRRAACQFRLVERVLRIGGRVTTGKQRVALAQPDVSCSLSRRIIPGVGRDRPSPQSSDAEPRYRPELTSQAGLFTPLAPLAQQLTTGVAGARRARVVTVMMPQPRGLRSRYLTGGRERAAADTTRVPRRSASGRHPKARQPP